MADIALDKFNARKRKDMIITVLCYLAAGLGLFVLALILGTLIWNGIGGLNAAVFTQMTPPPGSRGGLLNAIV
ncbi:MAG: phosphate transporter permease PstA, partial [Pseudomonadota bacterium]